MKYQPLLPANGDITELNQGVGEDSQIIRRYIENLLSDYYKPLSRQWANPVIRFSNLEAEWKESTAMLSSITEIAMHSAYQQIIGMGPAAISLIFVSMQREPNHWFWALKAISGEDPVSPEHRGNILEMTNAWLDWGKKHLYIS